MPKCAFCKQPVHHDPGDECPGFQETDDFGGEVVDVSDSDASVDLRHVIIQTGRYGVARHPAAEARTELQMAVSPGAFVPDCGPSESAADADRDELPAYEPVFDETTAHTAAVGRTYASANPALASYVRPEAHQSYGHDWDHFKLVLTAIAIVITIVIVVCVAWPHC